MLIKPIFRFLQLLSFMNSVYVHSFSGAFISSQNTRLVYGLFFCQHWSLCNSSCSLMFPTWCGKQTFLSALILLTQAEFSGSLLHSFLFCSFPVRDYCSVLHRNTQYSTCGLIFCVPLVFPLFPCRKYLPTHPRITYVFLLPESHCQFTYIWW